MGRPMQQTWLGALALTFSIFVTPAMAEAIGTTAPEAKIIKAKAEAPTEKPQLGPVTRLPMPRYVSMKASKANIRRGPSRTHRIDWVFMRRNMPLRVVAEFGHWRRVVDQEGVGGWIHHSLISGVRTTLVQKPMLDIRSRPNDKSPVTAQLELGVVARLHQCTTDWCRLSVSGYKGWAPKSALWGVDPHETRD